MKNYSLLTSLLCLLSFLQAQNEGNKWILGDISYSHPPPGQWSILDFSQQDTTIESTHASYIPFQLASASISHPVTGNLLFCTNGIKVSSLSGILYNGTNLSPCNYILENTPYGSGIPQSTLVLALPDNPDKYYIFHETGFYPIGTNYADTLQYSIVDYSQNANGEVTNKNNHLLTVPLAPGEITACRHANGRDWWILFPYYKANKYYEYLLKPDGLHGPYEIKTNENFGTMDGAGYACFSPDGKKYARYDAYIESKLYVYDFDRCSGSFSNGQWIDLLPYKGMYDWGSVTFSPNSRYLYLNSFTKLYQFDVSDSPIAAPILIGTYDGFLDSWVSGQQTKFGLSELAPNGKIYMCSYVQSRYLHTIHSPDSAGLACDFRQHDFFLKNVNGRGLPNMPDFNLGADSTYCDSTLSLHLSNQLAVNSKQVQVYPNPVEKELSISLQNVQEKTTFVLYDALGKVVLQQAILQGVEVAKINMAYLPKGMYFYLLKEEQGIVSQGKIIKE